MSTIRPSRSRTRRITLAASLAAVYFIFRSIPTFQMVGLAGNARFTAGDWILTSIALVGGLWSGTLSVLIGTILAYGVRPPIFFGLDFLPAVINVSITALILRSRYRIAQGIYLVSFLAFVLSPYSLLFGFGYVPYTWLHIVAMAVLLSPFAAKIPAWVNVGGFRQIASIVALVFVGTMGQHLVGGLLYESVAGFVGGISPSRFGDIWRFIFWVYPPERVLIVAISTVIALTVHRSLKKLNA